MAFAKVPGIFLLLLYLQYVNGQQGLMNNMNMGFNGLQVPPQQNIPNFKHYNQVPINTGAGNPNIPQQNFPPQANIQPTNNVQMMKQVNLQAPNKPAIKGEPLNMQQINLQKPDTTPTVNLQIPRQTNQIQANDMNFIQPPKATDLPLPVPMQITSFNFIPVDQMPCVPQTQLTFIPNIAPNAINTQVLPQSLQNPPNCAVQNHLSSAQNQQPIIQNSLPSSPNQFNPNQPFFAQPSLGPIHNPAILTAFSNQFSYDSIGPALITLQAQSSPFIPSQPEMIPIQGQPVITSLSIQNQQPISPIQVQPVVTYQDQSGSNAFQGSAKYIPFAPQYAPAIPFYTQFSPYPTPKSNKSSSLKAILPYIINLLQEKLKCSSPCPNCGCMNIDQEPQIFGGYANQKKYGTLPKEQNLPVVNIDPDETKTRFLREHKNQKKNSLNTESEEVSEEDSIEVADDGEDNTSDSH